MSILLKDKYVICRGKKLTYDELKPNSTIPLIVICDSCGKEFISNKFQLETNGHQKCKTCVLIEKKRKYLTIGDKYGRLTVIGHSERPGYSICECECGNIKEYFNYHLKSGETKSCGCFQKEVAAKQCMRILKVDSEDFYLKNINLSKKRNKLNSFKEYKIIRKYNKACCCIRCLSSENVEIHHIISFSIDQTKYIDPNNIVPLCRKCHREYHKIYGITGGEKEFNEYLNTPFDPLI